MEWLIEALRVLREVRDWTDTRTTRTPSARATHAAVARATRAVESLAPEDEAPQALVRPLGPAPAVRPPPPPPAPPPRERSRRGAPSSRGEAPLSPVQEIPLAQIDPNAVATVRRLRRYGFKAYLVGGCVRDLLLDLEPKDFDIATDARPEEVKSIFRNSRIIGRRFRLVHLYFHGGKIMEVSTFRANATPEDDEEGQDLLIRRDNVFGSEEEDARRRDFTINGLFYDVTTGRIIDHVGGLADVRARYLRMIGDPEIRLREDPIRILRAIRFTAKTGLEVDPDLAAAISRHKHEITRCAPARVLEETLRLLRIGHAEKTVRLMESCGVLRVLLPEIQEYLEGGPSGPGPRDAPRVDQRAALFSHLAALDQMVARGPIPDAVVLAALLAAPLESWVDGEAGGADRGQGLAELIAQIGARIALTRRLGEQVRQISMAQRHLLAQGAGRRRRRKGAPQTLIRRAFFPDALYFAEVRLRAAGQPLDEIVEWHERARDVWGDDLHGPSPDEQATREADASETEPDDEPEEGPDSSDRPRRRRRRGGRGRRRDAQDGGSATTSP